MKSTNAEWPRNVLLSSNSQGLPIQGKKKKIVQNFQVKKGQCTRCGAVW